MIFQKKYQYFLNLKLESCLRLPTFDFYVYLLIATLIKLE